MNAGETIAHAVSSALMQDRVAEVVVVDDGSRDDTADVAAACDDGTGRLNLIRLPENHGPAHGRNRAIASSTAPFICILDADDFMAPDRLEKMFNAGRGEWDFLADSIIFTEGPDDLKGYDTLFAPDYSVPRFISLSDMILGNMPKKDRHRRELGFVKPVMRRAFLEAHNLKYDENLRLGEDVLFYSTALLKGARFHLIPACGYYAVERANSLSSRHGTADLDRLARALLTLEGDVADHGQSSRAVRQYRRNIEKRKALRDALDAKRSHGWIGFTKACGNAGRDAGYVVGELVRGKVATMIRGR